MGIVFAYTTNSAKLCFKLKKLIYTEICLVVILQTNFKNLSFTSMSSQSRLPENEFCQDELKLFFISHLNRIYCAKNQLLDKLPELAKRANFLDLQQSIAETIEIVQGQVARMREIYIALDDFYKPEGCGGLAGILDEAFQSIGIGTGTPAVRDLSLLFYMQNIESIEMASFKVMEMVAAKMNRPQIVQALQECYDEAKDDKILLKQITEKYLH